MTNWILLIGVISQFAFAGAVAPSPNDPYFSRQWALNNDGTQVVDIDVDDSHTILQKGVAGIDIGYLLAQDQVAVRANAPVIVAVIDSGIDPTHPDLQGRIASDGYDFLAKSAMFTDDMGHGTHVSGTIAANSGNRLGIVGIAPPSVKILPLKVLSTHFNSFSYEGKLISDYAADAINYAVAHHASVINMSLSWPKIADSQNARIAVKNAVQAGVAIVVSAGNDRKADPTYPCAYEGVLCVGALTNNGQMTLFSNTGGLVDLLAPGDGILSTYPLNAESKVFDIQGYEILSGTSQASPQVAGVAATLKSIFPTITLNELKARLLLSGGERPRADSSLYGLVNLPRAINATPRPVFLPDFKSLGEIAVDEKTLQVQGSLTVSNLWANASNVNAQVLINGIQAGSLTLPTLASGAMLTIPWMHQFASLGESSSLVMTLNINEASGISNEFSVQLAAVRPMQNLATQTLTHIAAPTWIGSTNGQLYSKLSQVPTYGLSVPIPAYYQQLAYNSLQVFNPSSATPVTRVALPTIQKVEQIFQMDADLDGRIDWVITGLTQVQNQIYLEFYFLAPDFSPLRGDQSAWQVACPNSECTPYFRDYTASGSWIQLNGKLVPSFVAQGALPAGDNFDSLDPRHYQTDNHLFYLTPQTLPPNAPANSPMSLQIHAIDNAAFRINMPYLHLENIIPQSQADVRVGHLRFLFENGKALSAKTFIWDLPSVTTATLQAATGWDSLSSSGTPGLTLPGISDTFLSFFDDKSGALTWSTPAGRVLDYSEFTFSSPENPITQVLSAFDLQAQGRVWFAESGFDLISFNQASGSAKVESKTLPIERDSSFSSAVFSEMFTPILMGTQTNPIPGVYIDSTLVNGNRLAIALFNPLTGDFSKPLRYSLQVPADCVEMNPIHITSAPDSFRQPLLCQNATLVDYRLIQP